MIAVAAVLLAIAAACFLVRAVIGPSLADRVVAVDGLVVTIVSAIVLRSVDEGDAWFLDVAVVVAFIGFVGTAASARFIERRGG
jgi:multicomponent Na+:H+ antiporter subunit F